MITDGMVCAICRQPIPREMWARAMCWTDPGGQTCVAHRACLAALGEFELGLEETPW